MEACYHLTLPDNGTFDVSALSRRLSANPAVFRHPNSPQASYIVCADATMVPSLHGRLLNNLNEPYDTQGVIVLRPEYISVYQSVPQEIMSQIADFIVPLIRDLNCNIINEFGDDITDRYRGRLEALFGN